MASSKNDGTKSGTTTSQQSSTLPADTQDRMTVLAPVRLAALAVSAKLDAGKLRTMKLAHARLTARYGAGSTQVTALEGAFDARVAATQTTALDVQRARVVPVPIDTSALTVHGRVVDSKGNGVKGATVTAHRANGKVASIAKTDTAGHYHLKIVAVAAARSDDDKDAKEISLHVTPAGGKVVEHPRRVPLVAGGVELIELAAEA